MKEIKRERGYMSKSGTRRILKGRGRERERYKSRGRRI